MLEESQETPPEQADQDDGAAVAAPDAPEAPAASTPRRRRGRRPAGAASAKPEPAAEAPRRGRGGGVARETYAEVERLTAKEGLSKADAFARLAEASGRRPATVAAAYYRAARAAGVGRPRRRRAAAAPAGDGVERLVAALRQTLGELGEIVGRQEQELERLRADAERYAEVRALLEGGAGGRTGRRRRGGG